MTKLDDCIKKGLIKDYPKWLPANVHYLSIVGSQSYGVSTDNSDTDILGWCIPPKELVFPHLAGEIEGFGTQKQRFDQFQMHHVKDTSKNVEYDFTIYSIVKYFQLVMENNPNMIDSLFVPLNCILHITKIGTMVRDNRHEFLHKGSYHKMRGYSFSQKSKIQNGANRSNPKRKESYDKFGFDVKFLYHCVRLMDEAEQILVDHDLDLQKNNEHYKAIRRGEVSLEEFEKWFANKELILENAYANSTLRNYPDEAKIKQLLLNCLEDHYGTIENAISVETNYSVMGDEIRDILKKFGI